MTTQFFTGGQDLDAIFATGSGGSATGFRTPGPVDLYQRYAPYVSGTKAPATGFRFQQTAGTIVPNQKVGMHMDGTNGSTIFTDVQGNTVTRVGASTATISTAQSKFGGASCLFNGDGGLTIGGDANQPGLTIGTSEFAVSFWFYLTDLNGGDTFGNNLFAVEASYAQGGGFFVWVTPAGNITYQDTVSGLGYYNGGSLTTGAWHLFEADRPTSGGSANNLFIYIDGTLVYQNASLGSNYSSGRFYIGGYATSGSGYPRYMKGYIDDFQLGIGSGSAWHTGASYTVPTQAFGSSQVDLADIFAPLGGAAVLRANVAPTSLSATAALGATATTAAATVTPTGGTGSYSTYAWTRTSGDSSVTITSPSATSTTFSRAAVATNGTYTATFVCTVTDSASNTAVSNTVTVTLSGPTVAALSVTTSPTSTTGTGLDGGTATSGTVAGTATGGAGDYTYLWNFVSGDSSVTPNSPTSSATTFKRPSVVNGSTYSAVYFLQVTDGVGTIAQSANVTVTLTGVAAFTATISPDMLDGAPTTTNCTCAPSGGTAPFTYRWNRISGSTRVVPTVPTGAVTRFTVSPITPYYAVIANYACTVTDATGNTCVSNTVVVSLNNE